MFEDFSFCTECDYYDRNDRLCKLFQCVRVNGCQCGEERKPRNNFERLKAMSMEELAEELNFIQGDAYLVGFNARAESRYTHYGRSWLEWLKEEVHDT